MPSVSRVQTLRAGGARGPGQPVELLLDTNRLQVPPRGQGQQQVVSLPRAF